MISERVRRLVATHLASVDQLEILLLLRKHSDRDWTAQEVDEAIQSNVDAVRGRLDDLHARGFLERRGDAYRYAAVGELEAAVGELADTYVHHRFAVIELVFARPSETVRVFADAFRIRRKGDG